MRPREIAVSTAALDEVVKALLYGLITDGAHHKQHELERALRLLCGDEWVEQAACEFQWEKGMPA